VEFDNDFDVLGIAFIQGFVGSIRIFSTASVNLALGRQLRSKIMIQTLAWVGFLTNTLGYDSIALLQSSKVLMGEAGKIVSSPFCRFFPVWNVVFFGCHC
jgi:hypothetical protein